MGTLLLLGCGGGGGPGPMPPGLLTGLRAFYRNDGTDHSGNGYTLDAVGSPGTGTGLDGSAGTAMTVDSYAGNYWSKSGAVWFGISDAACSVAYWVYFREDGYSRAMSEENVAVSPHRRVSLEVYPSSGMIAFLSSTAFAFYTGTITLNEWHHVAMTFDGVSALGIYLDGLRVATATVSVNPFTGDPAEIQISGNESGAPGATAKMEYVGAWASELTNVQVWWLYQAAQNGDPTNQ